MGVKAVTEQGERKAPSREDTTGGERHLEEAFYVSYYHNTVFEWKMWVSRGIPRYSINLGRQRASWIVRTVWSRMDIVKASISFQS